jgi:hypothetical protein
LRGGRRVPPTGGTGDQPPIFVKTNCAPLKTAYGDFSRRSICFSSSHRTRFAGLRREPCFLRKENAPLTVEKKQRRVPAKALAGIPAPELRNGDWASTALPCAGTNKQRQSGFDRAVTDCLCFLFAAAIKRTKGSLREPHAESPCFAPHGGSKMTAGTIVLRPERTHHHNSRGRDS